MGSMFDGMLGDMGRVLDPAFGRVVVYTPGGGVGREIVGHFRLGLTDNMPSDAGKVIVRGARVTVRTADVDDGGAGLDASVAVDGVTYGVVREVWRNAERVMLELEERDVVRRAARQTRRKVV